MRHREKKRAKDREKEGDRRMQEKQVTTPRTEVKRIPKEQKPIPRQRLA
ncbi:MAG: hypothetical protein HFI32_06200 [Lachnospiraceae bacterium]|nr:hypothetical protein [Lachnospiraceae bacterium]